MAYKTVSLKNGGIVSLNWLQEEDLPEVMEALNSVIREDKYLLIDREIIDLESERRRFRESEISGTRSLVARVDGKVVGGAGLTPFTGKRAQVAEFGIYIIESQRNLGLGTLILIEFIDIAKKSHFETVQLSVFSNNKRAIRVYRKCGFKKCGKLTRDIKFADDSYADRILMEKLLTR